MVLCVRRNFFDSLIIPWGFVPLLVSRSCKICREGTLDGISNLFDTVYVGFFCVP